ncbi:MAG TPA: hypothetical protein VF912_12105 [Anaeromyxobacter sp.]
MTGVKRPWQEAYSGAEAAAAPRRRPSRGLPQLRERDRPPSILEGEDGMNRRSIIRARRPQARIALARIGTALVLTSMGALALGAVAVGALAIGALAIKTARIQRLEIETLVIGGQPYRAGA